MHGTILDSSYSFPNPDDEAPLAGAVEEPGDQEGTFAAWRQEYGIGVPVQDCPNLLAPSDAPSGRFSARNLSRSRRRAGDQLVVRTELPCHWNQ